MPHNESTSERKPESEPVVDTVKPSKFARVKSAAVTTGIFVIPTVVTVGASIIGYRTGKMEFDAAKLNLETAKLAAAAIAPKS